MTVHYVEEVCGLYFRAISLKANELVPQHTHDYDHVTLVASGKIRMWVEGKRIGDFEAFKAIKIEARKKHAFQALEPDTRIACVHNLQGREYAFLSETAIEV